MDGCSSKVQKVLWWRLVMRIFYLPMIGWLGENWQRATGKNETTSCFLLMILRRFSNGFFFTFDIRRNLCVEKVSNCILRNKKVSCLFDEKVVFSEEMIFWLLYFQSILWWRFQMDLFHLWHQNVLYVENVQMYSEQNENMPNENGSFFVCLGGRCFLMVRDRSFLFVLFGLVLTFAPSMPLNSLFFAQAIRSLWTWRCRNECYNGTRGYGIIRKSFGDSWTTIPNARTILCKCICTFWTYRSIRSWWSFGWIWPSHRFATISYPWFEMGKRMEKIKSRWMERGT